jgi:PAS domain S-box-containing protein
MKRRRLWTLLILCFSGIVLGTLGTWSWRLGHGFSAIWPALVVQVAGGIWFGGCGVLAAVLFPMVSNALVHDGLTGILGYIPANIAQGLLPAWAFRHFRMDPAIPGRKGVQFYFLWGAIVPSAAGALLGVAAVVMFGEDSWGAFPWLFLKWAVPHAIVSAVIGIPVLRIFTPLWRDLGLLVVGWWGLDGEQVGRSGGRRFRDLPIQLKLVLAMCGLGLSPLLVLSLLELRRSGGAANPTSSAPLFLTLGLVASVLAVGWLSREVVRPLLELRKRVENLMPGREVSLAQTRKDEIGQVARAFEVLLHDRKQADEAVRASVLQLQAFVENAPYGITRSSVKDDRFLEVNPAAVKMLGYESEAEVLALRLSTGIHTDPDARHRIILELSKAGGYHEVEMQWKRKDGRPITVQGATRLIRSTATDDLVIEGIVQDITERRLLEEQLRQAQKMEAIGRLAGGVAHDFNNLLGVILGYGELLAGELAPDTRQHRKVEAIRAAGERAATLTSQLLAFSRRQVLQPKVVNLNAIVSETEKMLGRLLGEDVELRVVLERSLKDIKADPGQVAQVIMNLAVNARDAMPTGGTLAVATKNVSVAREVPHEGGVLAAGEYSVLAVTDTGLGMDANTRAHIFEPFFTTKKVGEGTGLGLAIVYGIVKQSAGQVLVHSALGEGTVFEVYFPQVQEAPVAAPPRTSVAQSTGGSETILLVEDAAALRELLHESLEMLGYRVLAAANGQEAARMALQHDGAIHLLLTDIVMPRMNGLELAQQIAAIQPEAKVLYMSGHANDALARARVPESNMAYLQKPFTLEGLAEKLQEVLMGKQTNHPAMPPSED